MREQVCKWGDVFDERYKPIRNKFFAHIGRKPNLNKIDALFKKTNKEEIHEMMAFLHAVKNVIEHLYLNGVKFELKYFVDRSDYGKDVVTDMNDLLDSLKNSVA